MTMGERIKALRTQQGLTQEELGEKVGVKKSAIYKYETGLVVNLKRSTIEKLAKALGVKPTYLMGMTNEDPVPPGFSPMPQMDQVPLVGRVACGTPITAEQNIERMVSVPSDWRATFTLKCKGKSMEPRILDGDLVAIRKQPMVENGEVAAVRIGEEATLKHVYVYSKYIELRPENPEFESIIKIGDEMEDVVIEGKAVGLCRGI